MQLAKNSKVYHDYTVSSHFVCGLELFGHEVKSIKSGGANLTGSMVIVRGGETYVVGLKIRPYQTNNKASTFEEDRTVKLLLTKNQISELYDITKSKTGFLIPLSLFTDNQNGFIKMDLGVCKKLQKYDKREKIKERDLNRRES